jgi:hypothetical protein
VLVRFHIHLPPSKAHTFCFQPKALFKRIFTTQLDFATGA